jgi:hypothetical protein
MATAGMRGYVGKTCMDCNSPDYYRDVSILAKFHLIPLITIWKSLKKSYTALMIGTFKESASVEKKFLQGFRTKEFRLKNMIVFSLFISSSMKLNPDSYLNPS